jgi:hypothetical protein
MKWSEKTRKAIFNIGIGKVVFIVGMAIMTLRI